MRDVVRVWLAHPPHDRQRPRLVARDAMGLEHWQASYDRSQYADALNALVAANLAWWRFSPFHPGTTLYDSGLIYKPECCGEIWRTFPAILLRGGGDCEDLAAARVAELHRARIDARILIREVARTDADDRSFHVLVALPDGSEEDPSELLGAGDPVTRTTCDPIGPGGAPCRG